VIGHGVNNLAVLLLLFAKMTSSRLDALQRRETFGIEIDQSHAGDGQNMFGAESTRKDESPGELSRK
jgi:hypothetical protein